MIRLESELAQVKRDKLLEFIPNQRNRLIRCLVFVKWLKKNHSKLSTLEEIHSVISTSEQQYWATIQNCEQIFQELIDTMQPLWDIESAIHVLSTQSYRLLPLEMEVKKYTYIHTYTHNIFFFIYFINYI